MEKKNVLFYFKHYRGRHYDVIDTAPDCIRPVTNKALSAGGRGSDKRRPLIRLFEILRDYYPFLINRKNIDSPIEDVDMAYLSGSFLKNDFPYVTEMDNPAVFTYYSLPSFFSRVNRKRLVSALSSGRLVKILALSEASRRSFLNYFDGFGDKVEVVYPPLSKSIRESKSHVDEDCIKFTFVANLFYAKGGLELLKAVESLEKSYLKRMRLTIVSRTFPQASYERFSRGFPVTIHNSIARDAVFGLLSESDVLVHPTFNDSFGMIVLEAVASGLGVIANDVFAVPEMVSDGWNGFLNEPAISPYDKDFRIVPQHFDLAKADKIKQKTMDEQTVSFLREKIMFLVDNPEYVQKFKKNSLTLAKQQFDNSIRNKKLCNLFQAI